jgi:hypothetical protein
MGGRRQVGTVGNQAIWRQVSVLLLEVDLAHEPGMQGNCLITHGVCIAGLNEIED